MPLHLEIPGKTDDCQNCTAIANGDQEGTCLCCGAVWGVETSNPRVPNFAGETNLETNPDGSSYKSRHSFRVF